MKKIFLTTAAAVLLSMATSAMADDSFQGTVWSLSYSGAAQPDADPLKETFRVTLDVDTDGYQIPDGSFLDQVALKVSSAVSSVSLFSAPTGAANWTIVGGQLAANGCSGNGSGWTCANSSDTIALNNGKGVAVDGAKYSWIFDITVANNTLFTALDQSSVKGRFVTDEGTKVGDLVSENTTVTMVTAVPEVETYAMMLAGLGLMGTIVRRRKNKAA